MKDTEELEHEIRRAESPDALLEPDFRLPPLPEYLHRLLDERGMGMRDVILRCNMDRTYAYQLFNGTRRPTREFLVLFAMTLKLDQRETQRLLKIAGRPSLYARDRRDAGILYVLNHGLTPGEADTLLRDLGLEGLF